MAFEAFKRQRKEEEEGGFISSIFKSLAADIKGATKVGLAIPFSAFESLGAEVPFTFDDLTSRDYLGAAAVASIGVGGVGASAARSIFAGQGLKALPFIGSKAAREAAEAWAIKASVAKKVAIFAGSEAAAGAFFGSIKPLQNADDRLESIIQDAALFGTFGAGTSLAGSAFRATIGGRLAQLKGTTKAALLQETAKRREITTQLSEFAGISLRNPESGIIRNIHKLADGSVKAIDEKGTRIFESFDQALSKSLSQGFEERLGLSRSKLTSSSIKESIPEDLLRVLNAADGDLASIIDESHFTNYKSVRDALSKGSDEGGLWNWLGAETVVPNIDGLGAVALAPGFRQDVLRVVPKDVAKRMAKIEDPSEFLRQAALEGALDVDNLLTGAEMRNFVDELFINDVAPTSSTYYAHTPYDATMLAKLATPRTIAKMHPEIQPLVDLGSQASELYTLGVRDQKQFLFDLLGRVGPKAASRGVDIIDASAEAGGIQASKIEALRLAKETGDEQVIAFVEDVTERLNIARLRFIAAGRLGGSDAPQEAVAKARQLISEALENTDTSSFAETLARSSKDPVVGELLEDAGLAGYFPIVHSGQIRADINGIAEPAFFDSFNEARKFIAEQGSGGFISNAMAVDATGGLNHISPKEFGKLINTIRSVDGVEISAAEAGELLKNAGTLPSSGPRKFSQHLLPRKLGTRDFADDPFKALEVYLNNSERTLAFNTFSREADKVLEGLPVAKSGLKAWGEDQRDILLGKPSRSERMVADIFKNIAPEVSQATLRKYSGMLRWGQGLFKLGGFWSGVVNSTQFAVNTVPLLGPKYSAEGLSAFFNPAKKRSVEALIAKHKVDLGLHVSLTREGSIIGAETISGEIRGAIKKAAVGNTRASLKGMQQAAENMWMFSFNTAERMNRLGTFWGKFRKGIDEGLSEIEAVAAAKQLTLDTQFDYSIGNLPQALQGPVGGVLGQFKTFFINEVELIASLDNASRLKMAVAFQALGGAGAILAVPGIDLIDNASRYFFDVKISEAIKLEGGKEDSGKLARFAAFGAPGLFNADLTNYIGPGGFDQLTMGLLGPTVSDLGAWKNFIGQGLKDIDTTGYLQPTTINTWMQQVMPAQLRRYTRGKAIYDTGEVRNAYSGKLIYRPEDRLKSALATGIGIPKVADSLERIQDGILARETDGYRKARESYRRQIALASIAKDTGEIRRLQTQASAAGYVFTPQDIRRAVGTFSKTSRERRELRTPIALRTEFEDFFELP